MKIWMIAQFRLLEEKDGKLEILNKKDVNGLSVGGFTFNIAGNDVPIDWDAFVCNESNGVFTYESGIGFTFNDPEPSDCYEEDWAEMGLSRFDITSSFLSSADSISDFHINYWEEGESGEEIEVDLGDNLDPNMPIRIHLLAICFEDEKGNLYEVKEEILKVFNEG